MWTLPARSSNRQIQISRSSTLPFSAIMLSCEAYDKPSGLSRGGVNLWLSPRGVLYTGSGQQFEIRESFTMEDLFLCKKFSKNLRVGLGSCLSSGWM